MFKAISSLNLPCDSPRIPLDFKPVTERLIQVEFSKEEFKFSAAHMTVFSETQKEALHGHNYQVSIKLQISSNGMPKLMPFSEFKKPIRALCSDWDEKVLLPSLCRHLKIINNEDIRFELCGKRYQIPKDEIVLLPIDNVSCENLSALFLEKYIALLKNQGNFTGIESVSVTVCESPGQSVTSQSSMKELCPTN